MPKPELTSLSKYLKSVGLEHHPFEPLEASADRRLNQHSIEHPVLFDAWERDVCFIVGESGSGRTAIAEGLLYNCRVGSDRTEIFPICLREAELTSVDSLQDQAVRAAAVETVLELAYQPWKFEDLELKDRFTLTGAIESAAPGILNQFLPQILKAGSHLPVARFADPPAEALPNRPDPSKVKKLARQMQELNLPENLAGKSSPSIFDIVPAILGLTEIKLIADFPELPDNELLVELDRFCDRLSQRNSVSKVILAPAETRPASPEAELIRWHPEQLIDVLTSRMRTASGGNFESFDAISDPGLRDIEEKIVNETASRDHRTPRAVLSLAKTLLELQAQSGNEFISSDTFQKAVEKEFAASV